MEIKMSKLLKIENYKPILGKLQTERGIKMIKDFFQQNLSTALCLHRVTGPLFVLSGTGINDDLSGTERPVSFQIKDLGNVKAEVVHSLAKWKRLTLATYGFKPGYGIYTDMNAIRADEELDNTHSLYVDQWDWERVITAEDRNLDFLYEAYPMITPQLPEDIFFIHAEELRRMYPDLTPRERENVITKEKGAVFILGIGCKLGDGKPHDLRAPDYDDYSTIASNGLPGLNGDILVWDDVLGTALELSSMGIRVDKTALLRQLKESGQEQREKLYFHKRLLEGSLPLSIGGGIGQSRLCMYYLKKAHIGEIQSSIWPEQMRKECEAMNISLI